jgi:hypothetical protein
MVVYEDFFFYKSGIYQHTTGAMAGGHAVMIVGYNEAQKYWIIRNSWGEDWGENGFAKISWDDTSGIGLQTWGVVVGDADGFVTLGNLRDREVLRGKFMVTPDHSFSVHPEMDVMVSSSNRTVFLPRVPENRFEIDTTKFSDGIYTLTAVATIGGKTVKSQPKTVFILNSQPKASNLKFTNVKEGQELKAAAVLEFETESLPVPFKTVSFQAKHLATGEVITRSTPNVASKMAMSWRTQGFPVGEYELSLKGSYGHFGVETKGTLIKVIR